jgi:hypothetical protein
MHSITVSQVRDDDDDIITTATSDPCGLAVSVLTTGQIIDVDVDIAALRPHGADGLSELFVALAQAAFAQRYDPLLVAN